MTTAMLSFPTGLDSLFEDYAEGAKTVLEFECTGAGCGSSEYDVKLTPGEDAKGLLHEFSQYVMQIIAGAEIEPHE